MDPEWEYTGIGIESIFEQGKGCMSMKIRTIVLSILLLLVLIYAGLIARDQVQLRGTYAAQGMSPELILRPSFLVPWTGTWQFGGTMIGGNNEPMPYVRHGDSLSMKMDQIDKNGKAVWWECRIEGGGLNWMMVDLYTRK
jgi:hypothetical protein